MTILIKRLAQGLKIMSAGFPTLGLETLFNSQQSISLATFFYL